VKFRCERDVLAEALGTASRVATSATGARAHPGIKAELVGGSLTLTGGDVDLTVQVAKAVQAIDDGAAVLPAKLATEIVRSLPDGAITVSCDGDEGHITAGRSHFTVRLQPVEHFPRLSPPPPDRVTLDANELNVALRQVVRAASGDNMRPILTGVLMAAEGDGLRLVATDSYRLAVRDLPGTSVLREGQAVLVPSRSLGELQRLLSPSGSGSGKSESGAQVTVGLAEREVTFEVGDSRLITRLLEGDFPNYRQLIPSTYPNRLVVGREPLLDAVKRVKLLAREAAPIRLSMRADVLELTAITQDVGQASEEVDAKFEGSELVVAFNPDFLITGVEAVAGDEVALDTLDTLKPAVLRSTEGSDYLYLLMPVRVP
jgi:DNA polymerase-3 subunit beta